MQLGMADRWERDGKGGKGATGQDKVTEGLPSKRRDWAVLYGFQGTKSH